MIIYLLHELPAHTAYDLDCIVKSYHYYCMQSRT